MCDPEQSCAGGKSPKYRMHPDLIVKEGDLIGDGTNPHFSQLLVFLI
jgi:hypothetical protein